MKSLVQVINILFILAFAGCVTPPPTPEAALPPAPDFPPMPAGISSKDLSIKGQVFIVTKGGQTFKISGAIVAVYPAEYLEARRIDLLRFQARASMSSGKGNSMADIEADVNAFNRAKAIAFDAWSNLPPPSAKVVTDADGRFEISGNLPERYALFCRSTRATFDDVEQYVWVIPSDKILDPARIIMSNADLQP